MRQSTQLDLPFFPSSSDRQAITPSEFSSSAANVEESNFFSAPKTLSSPSSFFSFPPSLLRSLWSRSKSEDRKVDSPDCAGGGGLGVNGTICQPAALNHPREEGQYRRVAREREGPREIKGFSVYRDPLREILSDQDVEAIPFRLTLSAAPCVVAAHLAPVPP